MSEIVVTQVVKSGATDSFFAVDIDGSRVASRSLDTEVEADRLLLDEAQRAAREAQRAARLDADRHAITVRGDARSSFLDLRDRHAETQAMVRAFVGVVFPGVC